MAEAMFPGFGSSTGLRRFPKGDYRIIAWDLNLTGRRLVDEICEITAFFAEKNVFSQYIMPYSKPNMASLRYHNISVVTGGRLRVLRHAITRVVLPSKCEYTALLEFMAWLEKSRGKDGVILMSFERRQSFPFILLESLARFELLGAFSSVVKGFLNGFEIAQKKMTLPASSCSLRLVARIILGYDKSQEIVTSLDRSRAIMEIVKQMCHCPAVPNSDQEHNDNDFVAVVEEFTHTVDDEKKSLKAFKELLVRQNTFRPIFGPMYQKKYRDRQRACVQRLLIAETGHDYQSLLAIFQADGSDGLVKIVVEKLANTNFDVKVDVLKLLFDHFGTLANIGSPAADKNSDYESKSTKKMGSRSIGSQCDPGEA